MNTLLIVQKRRRTLFVRVLHLKIDYQTKAPGALSVVVLVQLRVVRLLSERAEMFACGTERFNEEGTVNSGRKRVSHCDAPCPRSR
jgi:hypothetical protein